MDHRGNPLPLFLVDQIRRLRREGVSIRTIAAISGVAKSTVEIYCNALPVPGKPQRLTATAVLQPVDGSRDDGGEPTDADLARVEHGMRGPDYDPLLDEYLADE